MKLNDSLITSTNNTYAYRAYLETLLSYGPTAKRSKLRSVLYYKDAGSQMECYNPNTLQVANPGLLNRQNLVAVGRVVDMILCIHNDFFQDKYIPNDVTLRIRLVRQKNAFTLISDEVGGAYKVKILNCKLHVRKAKLSASVFVAHAKALELGNANNPSDASSARLSRYRAATSTLARRI